LRLTRKLICHCRNELGALALSLHGCTSSKQKSRTNKFQALARRLYISPLYFYDLIWENACKMTKKEAGGQNENRCRDTKWGPDFCGGRRENLATREQYNRKLFFFTSLFSVLTLPLTCVPSLVFFVVWLVCVWHR